MFFTFVEILVAGDCRCEGIRVICNQVCAGVCQFLCCLEPEDEDDVIYARGESRQKQKAIESAKDVDWWAFEYDKVLDRKSAGWLERFLANQKRRRGENVAYDLYLDQLMLNSHHHGTANSGLHHNYNHGVISGLTPTEVVYHSLLNESLVICPPGRQTNH